MNSFYHKVAIACVCTALSFTLGANKEAKAATYTLTGSGFGVENDSTESSTMKAFVVGDLTHPTGDMYGHTSLNNFTKDNLALTPPENAISYFETFVDRTKRFTGYMTTIPRVVYRALDGHIHELSVTNNWSHFDITAATNAPAAAGEPFGYVGDVPRVVYRGVDGHIHELYLKDGQWKHFDISQATGAPTAAGNPMGYVGGVPRVVYRGVDGHIHELYVTDTWKHFDISQATGAPTAAGDPMGYMTNVPRVVYRGVDGYIHELYVTDTWKHFDLSSATGGPS